MAVDTRAERVSVSCLFTGFPDNVQNVVDQRALSGLFTAQVPALLVSSNSMRQRRRRRKGALLKQRRLR